VPPIPASPAALFLDFDGTLVEFAATPDGVRPDPDLNVLLGALHDVQAGGLAVVSGRPIAALDALLAPLQVPLAGIHGAERRDATGRVHRARTQARWLAPVRAELQRFVAGRPGLLLEDKGVALALHYRQAPEFEAEACATVEALLRPWDSDATLIRGSAVVEVCAAGCDKASALAAFLAEPPFKGRCPVYLGDDTNDGSALRFTEDLGGLAIAVGDRIEAPWRLANPAAVRAWLAAWVADRSRP